MLPLVLLQLVLSASSVLSEVYITIPNGQLKGRQEVTARKVVYYAFQNIPFAKPPVGSLRFKAPEPAESWTGTLDATDSSEKVCYQQSTSYSAQTEDCLYLNVYTPVDPSTSSDSLPVMVYFYGGGFLNGYNSFYALGPHYLIEHNVIIVTVNYRVGPFGFLSTGDTVIPGNFGLKDQNLGLKWVQQNIKYFAGDPSKVTIFGESAGGASVSYHLISKKSAGLFWGGIAQSGSALCPWSYQRHYKDIAYKLGAQINPSITTSTPSQQLLQVLQSATADQIKTAAFNFAIVSGYYDQMMQGFTYTPVIEPEHDTAFLTEAMYSAIASGSGSPVPLLIGIASEEQISRASDLNNFKNTATMFETTHSYLVNENMHITDSSALQSAGDAIHNIYTTNLLQNDLAAAVKFFSDTSFSRPIIHHAKLQSQYTDVYFYEFSYHGALGGNNVYVEGADRVTHSEDMAYLWAYSNSSNMDSNAASDVLTSKRFTTILTNFAKTLNPASSDLGITWPKVTPDNFQYLNFNDTLQIQTNPKGTIYNGWIQIYESMAVKPYDTF